MSGIRTLFVLAMLLWAGATAIAQQNTIYVRANGNDANNGATEATANLTIAGALADAQAGDIIDIGAGDFAGATVGYNVTFRGANAGMAIANWGAATNITSTITLGAPALEVYIEGVAFGAITPVGGASADALVTLSMCRFTESNTLSTAGLDWYELTVVGCAFDGNADNVGPNAASAITASGLDVFFVTESSFDDYAGPGVEVTGSQATVKVTYNNFTNCNSGGATSTGAVSLSVGSFTGATRINKNLFTTCSNGVTTSGALSGKDVTVQYNRFVGTPNGSFAIRNNGTGLLSASCNNYGTDAGNYVQGGGGANDIFVVVGSLLSGSIEAGPFNEIGTDTGGDLPGFEPDGDQQCGVAGPITTTSTSKSYFRVQDAIDASGSGATVTLFGNSSFTGNVSIAKDIAIRGADTASVIGKTIWSTINGSVVVTLAAESVKLVGLKITSPTATTLVTNGATTRTQINRCWLMVDPSTVVATVPSFGALHHTRSGELYVWGSRITRPVSVGQEAAQYMRAVSLSSSSASRLVYLEDNTLEGTIQITGMSMYAAVTVKNNTITDAGVDGLSITGNFVRTLSVTGNSILNSRENGIGIRGPATVGSLSATITGNKISGSGQSGSSFAAINIAGTSYGTQTWNDNHIADQYGSNKIFINGRTGYSPVATCNWWGITSEDDLLTKITGTVTYDNGVNGWRGAGGNSASVGYVASGAGSACTIRSFTITLAPTDVTCFGGSNGSIVTTLAGTQAGPTYSWTKANSAYTANTKDITNLTIGTYTVSINNGTGNVRTKSATINEPTQLSGTPSKTNITCNGANNGVITVSNSAGAVSATNPTPTYQYRLDKVGTEIGDRPAQGSNSFADLTHGNYDVYIIANGVVPTCERMIGTMTINEPSQLNASVAKVNISCYGLTNGSITLSNVTGGTHGELPSQTYTYRIDRQGGSIGDVAAQSSPTFSNLIAGTYDVYVIADGVSPTCERIVSTQVIFEPTLVMATVAKNNISCNGSVNGSINVSNPLGGIHADAESRAYSYMIAKTGGSITGPQGSGSFTNLGAGEYVVSVITASAGSTTPACTTVVSTQNIYEPSVVASTTSKKNISCNNATDGEISFTAATGGTHADAATRTYNYRAVKSGGGYDVTNATGSFAGLGEGTYTLSVIALADGPNPACTTSVTSQTVNLPSPVTATTTKTDISCATATDGEIRVTGATGGTHADAASRTYKYMIEKQGGTTTGPQSSGTFSGLGAGTYTISVIAVAVDATTPACTTTVAPQTIYVPTAITASVAKSNISCNGSVDGTITVSNPQGGTHAGAQLRNYQYAIVKVGSQTAIGPQISGSFTGLGAGEYNVFVIALPTGTAPACSTLVSTQTINEPTPVTAVPSKTNISCNNAGNGSIMITGATGGTHADIAMRVFNFRAVNAAADYDVTNNTGSFDNLVAGTYTLSVIALADGTSPACTTSVPAQTIYNPTPITATVAKSNITCNSANDGSITVTNAAGGTHTDANTRTYKYMIAKSGGATTGPQISSSFTGLSDGTYDVSVIADAVGSSPACTTFISTQTIYRPSTITADVAKSNITCIGANDGSITVSNAAGGTQANALTRTYSYVISKEGGATTGPQATGSFTGLGAGTYNVSIIAAATGSTPACTTQVSTQVIYEPSAVTASSAKNNITCVNANDGTISITGAAGGIHADAETRTYNYRAVKSGGGYDVTNNTGSFTSLGEGTYTLSVIALSTGSTPACTTSVPSQTIYNPTAVTAITTKTDISCNTATDGVITISNTAGGTHADATSRTYKYMIAKSGGSVTGPQSSNTFNGLGAGSYTVSVIAEANGSTPACTTQVSSQTIYLPSPITASIAKTNISCNGSVDGTITVTNPQGGTHADAQLRTYQFAIFKQGSQIPIGPQVSGVFETLAAGAYDVYVIAQQIGTAPACSTIVGTRTILEPSAVTASTSKNNITCNGATDGTISITDAAGGTHMEAANRTYNYRAVKSGGGYDVTNNTGSFTGLGAGSYTLSVIALATGSSPACTTSVTAQTIYLPSAITATTAKTNISCNNATDGTITVTNAAGGTHTDATSRTYQYMIAKSGGSVTGPQTTGSFSGLGAGEYTVSVIAEATGSTPACTTVVSTQNIYLPTAITATTTKTNITCNGSTDGAITVSNPQGGTHADAGTRAYTFMIAKSGGAVTGPQVSGSFTGLGAGTYNVSVIAAATGSTPSCTTLVSTQIIYQPTTVTATSTKTDITCNGAADGIITITNAAGGTHEDAGSRTYNYMLIKSGTNIGPQVSSTFNSLTAGTYTVHVIALATGSTPACTTQVNSLTIVEPTAIDAAPAVTSDYNGSQLSCPLSSDGSIASNPSGGVTPYTYLWEKLAGQNWVTVATTQNISGQSAGSFRVKVTDANGCNITKNVSLIAPEGTIIVSAVPVNTSCHNTTDGTITVTAGGGTGTKTYSKDNGLNYQSSNVFTGLAPGTYPIIVKDANNCTSAVENITITAPLQITVSSLTTNGPKNVGQSIEFTAVISGGTQNVTGDKYSYAWISKPTNAQTPVKGAETVGGSVTQKWSITTTTTDDNGTYTLLVTDKNGCTQTANVTVIIYPSTIYVSTSGNDNTGNGLAGNPLRTIQKANDVAIAGNTIEVQAGTFDESPVINKALTINGTATSYLGTGKFFVYGTASTITWGTQWSTSVFNNLGLNASASSSLQTVYNKVTAGSGATLWFIGDHTLSTTLTVNKQITLRGATASAGIATYTGCDIEPPASITYTGSGSDSTLFVFSGSDTKGLKDLSLKIPNAGQFARIPSGSAGNVDPVENVRFAWDHDSNGGTAHRRIFGVTNGSFSGGDKYDVAKFVYDAEDNGYGTGRFTYSNNGPLPWNSLTIGWKAEDGGTNTNLATIKTLEPMKSVVKLQSLVSSTRRPALYTNETHYNDKWYMQFDGVDEYLEGNTTADINGGSQKALFVVFRPLVGTDDQVIYKHGDEDQGISLVHLSDGRISLNIYDGTTAGTRESWIFEADATHSSAEFDDQVLIAQVYFNGNGTNNATRRVGAALDKSSGRLTTDVNHTGADKTNGYVDNVAFTPTTLTTPAVIGPANLVSLGARTGSVYYASWNAGAAVDNSLTTTGRSLWYKGSVAEVLILSDASESARDAAYCYLRNKYYSGNQSTENGLNKGVIAGEVYEQEESVVAWPNPADNEITIEAMIPQSGNVVITLRDALGRPVQQLHEGFVVGGTQIPVNGNVRNVQSGAYFIHVQGAGDLNLSLPIIIRH